MCFDMMMRGTNTLLFPYVAITLMDEFGELCLGCEGMVCGETYKMYSFIVQFVARECPGMPLSKVKIVSADGFFSQDYVRSLGFENANYVMDRWHLKESGLRDYFGRGGEELLHDHLMHMLNACSQTQFERRECTRSSHWVRE